MENSQNVSQGRLPQIVLIVCFAVFSWLAFMAVHELGHMLTAWMTGGSVGFVVLHPLRFSWTMVSPNPHPLLVAWGGALWGSLLPLVLWAAAWLARMPGLHLFRFFAGFCLAANGLYLFGDSFERGADSGTLLAHGAAQWQLILFGFGAASAGLWLWNGLGRYFGVGSQAGRVGWGAPAAAAGLLAVTVALEVALCPAR